MSIITYTEKLSFPYITPAVQLAGRCVRLVQSENGVGRRLIGY
jgi:hypothetical protein